MTCQLRDILPWPEALSLSLTTEMYSWNARGSADPAQLHADAHQSARISYVQCSRVRFTYPPLIRMLEVFHDSEFSLGSYGCLVLSISARKTCSILKSCHGRLLYPSTQRHYRTLNICSFVHECNTFTLYFLLFFDMFRSHTAIFRCEQGVNEQHGGHKDNTNILTNGHWQ
jgi:hypothetical protein